MDLACFLCFPSFLYCNSIGHILLNRFGHHKEIHSRELLVLSLNTILPSDFCAQYNSDAVSSDYSTELYTIIIQNLLL